MFNSQRCWDQVVMFESTLVVVQPGVVDDQDSKYEKVSEFDTSNLKIMESFK